jgi:hypothetical protein
LSNYIINIILTLIVLSLLYMDGLVLYDMFTDETDITYEIEMILVSSVVFIAIIRYIKQRNKKNTQLQKL